MRPRRRNVSVTALVAAVAIALAALGACRRSGPVRRPGDEYVKDIEVEGNRQVKERELVAGLALERARQRKRPPDPYLVQLDEDRIRGEYLRRGFFGIDVRARVDRAGDASTIVYTVEEGVRAETRVVISGVPADPDLPTSKIRAALPLADGAPFEYAVYEEAKPRLLGVAHDAGYAHARLDSTVHADRVNRLAIVQLDYDLGPKCTFGPVEVTGVTGDLAEAVRARVQFKQGERYSAQAIAATQRQLYGMARFSTVQVQPEQAEETRDPVVGVKIAVAEASRREVRLGGGFGLDPTAYEARARAGYTIAGWPFPLDTVTLDLRPAYAYLRDGSGWQPRIRALARLERQDLLWTYARGEVEAGYTYTALEAYTSYGPRGRLGFLTPVKTERVQLGVGWTFERLGFRQLSPLIDPESMTVVDPTLAAELGLDGPQRVGAYTQLLTLDLRDHPIEPTRGAYAGLRSALGTRFAGGAFEFLQLVPELRGYVPLGPVVLGARARGGTFFGDVPVTERFFSGGASNHRGFGERRLSPAVTGDVDGQERTVPYGGEAVVETGVEARFPIATWRKIGIGGVVFFDGGDVREELSAISLAELHWAAGLGLRFRTLVGPIRADLGYRLNRTGPEDPAPGSRFAFHLALGEAF
jgi:translocation and assembly module TamA